MSPDQIRSWNYLLPMPQRMGMYTYRYVTMKSTFIGSDGEYEFFRDENGKIIRFRCVPYPLLARAKDKRTKNKPHMDHEPKKDHAEGYEESQ
jgi:hypothetical protein